MSARCSDGIIRFWVIRKNNRSQMCVGLKPGNLRKFTKRITHFVCFPRKKKNYANDAGAGLLGPWSLAPEKLPTFLFTIPPTITPISSSLRRYLTLCDFNFVSFHYVQVFTSCAFLWLNRNFRPRLLFKLRLQLNINRSSESFLASKHVQNHNPASLVNTSAFFPATPGRKPPPQKKANPNGNGFA